MFRRNTWSVLEHFAPSGTICGTFQKRFRLILRLWAVCFGSISSNLNLKLRFANFVKFSSLVWFRISFFGSFWCRLVCLVRCEFGSRRSRLVRSFARCNFGLMLQCITNLANVEICYDFCSLRGDFSLLGTSRSAIRQ